MELSVITSAPVPVLPVSAERAVGVPASSVVSVGQQAKAVKAIARASGIELPRVGQGAAPPTIPQGADPASVFSAITAPDLELPEPVIPFPGRTYALDFLNADPKAIEPSVSEREADAA